jgi:hypothetical protein
MRTRRGRSIIAIVAAYALALQALLSGWIVVVHAAAAASHGVICTHDAGAGGSPQKPAQDDACPCGPACAMAGHGLAYGLPDSPGIVVAWAPSNGNAVAAAEPAERSILDPKSGPHRPRAPPPA